MYVASRCVDATLRPSRPAARELGYGEHLAMQLALSAYVPAAASAHVLAVALHRNLVGGAGGDRLGEPQKMAHAGLSS